MSDSSEEKLLAEALALSASEATKKELEEDEADLQVRRAGFQLMFICNIC